MASAKRALVGHGHGVRAVLAQAQVAARLYQDAPLHVEANAAVVLIVLVH